LHYPPPAPFACRLTFAYQESDIMPRTEHINYDEQEPLSLAEELAEEASRGEIDEPQDRYEKIKQGEVHIAELQKMSMSQLIK
jgi:hypothetical protein